MNNTMSFFAVAIVCAAIIVRADVVSRDIGDPVLNVWKAGEWVTCGGEIIPLDERPSDPAAPKDAKALRLKVNYLPKKCGGWSAAPVVNAFPGSPVKLTAWMRLGNDASTPFER